MTASNQSPSVYWKPIVSRYRKSSGWRASWQFLNSFVPYIALWYLMSEAAQISWWLVVPLSVLAAGFLIRIFIIFHDCGHGSFFGSRRVNEIVGFVAGTLTFVPSHYWWSEHARHHASAGNLDQRGTGDIWTLTVREYVEASRWRRFAYRLARNPIALFVLAPFFMFVVRYRFAASDSKPKDRESVHWTNLAIVATAALLSTAIGLANYLFIQTLVMVMASAAGVWLFYVQHQFEGVYWAKHGEWDYSAAALQGSSYYKLPRVLQWFSGNIGFHHIHHLSPGVPSYYLEQCHRSDPLFRQVPELTLWSSLKGLRLRLWDERQGRLVGYPVRVKNRSR